MIQAIKRYFTEARKRKRERDIMTGIELITCRLLREHPGCAVRYERDGKGNVRFYILSEGDK